jgi:hypothetical protein
MFDGGVALAGGSRTLGVTTGPGEGTFQALRVLQAPEVPQVLRGGPFLRVPPGLEGRHRL